jgi:hypothetical protein
VTRTLGQAIVVALLGLVALWAFVSYLHPAFTGELAEALLRCN